MVLSLVLAESSIELVPNELVNHPSILSSARRNGRNPRTLILDQSYHHAAILQLGPSGGRRGRPDIAHLSLLAALGSPYSGRPLLSLKSGSLRSLLREISGDLVVALTTEGTLQPMDVVAAKLAEYGNPVVLVGGFPRGHFSREVTSSANEIYRISRHSLDAWTVVARAIYDYEKTD